jgi:hypothetical protein
MGQCFDSFAFRGKLSASEVLEAKRALDDQNERIIQDNMRGIALVSVIFRRPNFPSRPAASTKRLRRLLATEWVPPASLLSTNQSKSIADTLVRYVFLLVSPIIALCSIAANTRKKWKMS